MGSAASRQRDASNNEKGNNNGQARRSSCVPDPITVVETPREYTSTAHARVHMIKQQAINPPPVQEDDDDECSQSGTRKTFTTVGGGFGVAGNGGTVKALDEEEETPQEKAKRLRRERRASMSDMAAKPVKYCEVCKLAYPDDCLCLQEIARKKKKADDDEWRQRLSTVAMYEYPQMRKKLIDDMNKTIEKLAAEEGISAGKGEKAIKAAELRDHYDNQTIVDELFDKIAHRMTSNVQHPAVMLNLAVHKMSGEAFRPGKTEEESKYD